MGLTMEDPEVGPPPSRARVVLRIARQAGLMALFLATAFAGTLSGVLFAYADDLPEVSALDNYQPNTITRLLARDGQVVGEFAVERRVVIGYDAIAPALRNAIIAVEDAEFEQHFGLSVSRIVVTGIRDVLYYAGLPGGRLGGASTITQQLARDLFLREYMQAGGRYEMSPERKIREIIVAIQIEKRYTKREILTLYANQINLAHGAYGVEAGARQFFSKPAKDLTLEEAAMLAGMIQLPARLSPFVDPQRSRTRRNVVLQRMADEGFITEEERRAAAETPIVVNGQAAGERSIAPYFAEEIRQGLEQQYGADVLYQAGLQVQTTLDADLQRAANRALDRGLRVIDKRRTGYRRPAQNAAAGQSPDRFTSDRWARIAVGDIVPAVVTAAPQNGDALVRIGRTEVALPRAGFAWTRRTSPAALFDVGDVIEVEVRAVAEGVPTAIALEQSPLVEGALVAIDNRSGQILAMVGGQNFARSKFNRAVQARRQVGSIFKPIVYTLAIDKGFTPVSVFIDEPVAFEAGPNQPPYSPLNYDRRYEGPVTLRRALEDSRNIPAVKAMAELGARQVVDYAARFGFEQPFQPFLSTALGAGEATLVEVTSAYSAYPNQGVRMQPYSVVSVSDRDGNVLEDHRPEPHEAMRADTAFVMTNLMRGVVQRGTAASAARLDWPLAGKTGTVDENTDAWFVGFDPNVTVGVWVGYDEKKPIGTNETGATAALPIWIDFMQAYIAARGDRANPPQFEAPGNIAFVTLDSGITEAFINGTQPQRTAPVTPVPITAPPP
jgi:penicillin-binding protein 1A